MTSTLSTSDPRISLRFFAGYNYDGGMLDAPDVVARAYTDGVTMGEDLPALGGDAPGFLLWALVENPTCRWSTWDAIREGVAPRSDLAATIQERAWTSRIQFVPGE